MRLVIVESPFAGDVERNTRYARAAMRDCLMRGEAPLASHLLYTQPGVLDDSDHHERETGVRAGLFWGDKADATVVYTDLGISRGMQQGIDHALAAGRFIEYRVLPEALVDAAPAPAPEADALRAEAAPLEWLEWVDPPGVWQALIRDEAADMTSASIEVEGDGMVNVILTNAPDKPDPVTGGKAWATRAVAALRAAGLLPPAPGAPAAREGEHG